MKRKTLSFRKKLLGLFMLFTAIIFSVLWLLQTVFLQSFYNVMIIKNTKSAAKKITSYSSDTDAGEQLDGISSDNSLLVYITDTEGNILYCADEYKNGHNGLDETETVFHHHRGGRGHEDADNYRELPAYYDRFLSELASSDSGETEFMNDHMYVYGKYIDFGGEKAVLFLGTTLGAVGSAARIIRIQLMIVTFLSVGAGFVLAWFMSRRFSLPISQLNEKAHTLGENTSDAEFRKGFCSELDELSATLDKTDEKLKKNKEFQNELLANVSHDLRTPLTMIKGYAEMIRDMSHSDEKQCAEDVAVIVRETDRLTALVNEILEYSELQMSDSEPVAENVDYSGVVSTVTDSFESLYAKDGYVFERSIAENIRVRGNSSRLMRAVYNLIDNAVRHTGDGKWVGICLKEQDGRAVLEISDRGKGIPPEELGRIWDKYYTNRQRKGKGVSGLGLAIVRQTVSQHNGTCKAESTLGRGSVFTVELDVL